jgi:hypothetical protein
MARRNAQIVLVLAAIFAGCISSSQAALFTKLGPSYTVAQLLDSQTTIRAGDKVFSDFSFTNIGNGPQASAILLEPVLLNGEYGLHIVGSWTAFGSQVAGMTFSYQVTADAPNQITGATLWAPGAGSVGGGSVAIVENIFDQVPGPPLASPLLVYANANGSQLLATASIQPTQSFLFAFKDVIVQGGGGSGLGLLSEFFQTFPQVPEPATLGLLAIGGLAMLRRKRM